MRPSRVLLGSDLHFCVDSVAEIAATEARLPSGFFNAVRRGCTYWHNRLLLEAGEALLGSLRALAAQIRPDLCVFLGDLVNTNWPANVKAFRRLLRDWPCPVAMVTGNHDIYLGDREARVQEAVEPGTHGTGWRRRRVGGLELIFLDVFVRRPDGSFAGSFAVDQPWCGTGYRPEDVAAVAAHVARSDLGPALLCAHYPLLPPQGRLYRPGRRVMNAEETARRLAELLASPSRLLGAVGGHGHYQHVMRGRHGFHWSLPALCEYPCVAGLLEWSGRHVSGHLLPLDCSLARRSLLGGMQAWPAGAPWEQRWRWFPHASMSTTGMA